MPYRVVQSALGVLAAVLFAGGLARAQNPVYLEDFEFIRKTVQQESAALKRGGVDWKRVCEELRPAFRAAEDDVQHVGNVMRLLATLGDSHTDVWRTSVDRSKLPSKWDGLYGGGLWFAWEDGRVMLRGVMDGHPRAAELPGGSALVAIGDDPAWFALERERRRITTFAGSSSDHSLFSSMGNRLLPFGQAQTLSITILTPEGDLRRVDLPRWGPGGKAFYPWTVQFPEGQTWKEGAVATMLGLPWCEHVGWLRITGSMNQETVEAVHAAFDSLKGMEALVLDCRGMGGGGDGAAWELAGRLFTKPVSNGRNGRIEPSGAWQFDGPVVMLQDENEVSSAETFTWAVSETERVVSVGRNTGGWGIIPRVVKCPSGLVDFRLGVNDRPTPIRGIRTEGVGWPPDVTISHGPVLCAARDPVYETGLEILRLLHAGLPRQAVTKAFADLAAGDAKGFVRAASGFAKRAKGFDGQVLARTWARDLKGTLALEQALILRTDLPPQDAVGATRRLQSLVDRAKRANLTREAKDLERAVARLKAEVAAQEALLQALDAGFDADEGARTAFLKTCGRTRLGRWVREHLWRE